MHTIKKLICKYKIIIIISIIIISILFVIETNRRYKIDAYNSYHRHSHIEQIFKTLQIAESEILGRKNINISELINLDEKYINENLEYDGIDIKFGENYFVGTPNYDNIVEQMKGDDTIIVSMNDLKDKIYNNQIIIGVLKIGTSDEGVNKYKIQVVGWMNNYYGGEGLFIKENYGNQAELKDLDLIFVK